MENARVIAVRTNKTIYRQDDKVIKVFDPDYSKADVLNEALNQAYVEETGLKIPKVLEVMKVDGNWAIVSQYIPGKTLAQLMEQDPANEAAYLTRMIELQSEIHSKRSPMLNRLSEKMQRKISATAFDATTRYDLHTRLDGMPKGVCVCHGDFDPTNIIITPDDEAYVLDWAHVTQGNPAADAARSYLLFWLNGKIDAAERYLDLYCKMTDTAKQVVQKWIPIVAASQSVKGKPQEVEFLAHWVNVVEYV